MRSLNNDFIVTVKSFIWLDSPYRIFAGQEWLMIYFLLMLLTLQLLHNILWEALKTTIKISIRIFCLFFFFNFNQIMINVGHFRLQTAIDCHSYPMASKCSLVLISFFFCDEIRANMSFFVCIGILFNLENKQHFHIANWQWFLWLNFKQPEFN